MKMKIVNESGKSVYEKPQIGIVNLEMGECVCNSLDVSGNVSAPAGFGNPSLNVHSKPTDSDRWGDWPAGE